MTRSESYCRPLGEAWWSCSGWLRLSALFITARMEVEESPDLHVCYQLTTFGHLLPASLPLSFSLSFSLSVYCYLSLSLSVSLCCSAVCVCLGLSINNWVSIQVLKDTELKDFFFCLLVTEQRSVKKDDKN